MTIAEAQENMRFGYFGGVPGLLASGLVWVVAGLFGQLSSAQASIIALFVGGMFIHPISVVICKLLKRPGSHKKGNPLAALVFESTVLLFVGFFIAYAAMLFNAGLFFPIMMMIIGSRYLLFSTLYGLRIYWGIGGFLIVSGIFCTVMQLPFITGAFLGGAIELVSSVLVFQVSKSNDPRIQIT